jgi:DNA polymerase-1
MLESLRRSELLVIDTETTSLDPLRAELVGISLAGDVDDDCWYVPCGHRDGEGRLLEGMLDRQQVIETLRPFLEDERQPKVGHNLKYDLAVLANPDNGAVHLRGPLYDSMIGAWLLDPGRRSFKLDDLSRETGLELTSFSDVVAGDKREDAFCRVNLENACNYSCEDVFASRALFQEQRPELTAKGMWSLFVDLEGPLISVLAAMEHEGIGIEGKALETLSLEFGQSLQELEAQIYSGAGREFNISSPKQLGEILFEDLGLPRGRKTKTGYSTDVKVLEKLALQHELPRLILRYRNLAKLKSTYVDKLSGLIHSTTGRVHTSFNQCGTATGRLSSSNPNLQNIPIRGEEGQRIRSCFVAKVDHVFLAGDYSQIDLRVLAHYSKDAALLEAFSKGQDVHLRTASEIFFVSPELITSDMRRVAKTINFGIVYGMSSFGLSSQLQISRKEAQTFIDRYFDHYSGVRRFMDDIVVQARRDGYVTTLLHRRRLLPEINSSNRTRREFAERTAINTPIQGTAADIIKLAMLEVQRRLVDEKMSSRLILQIHDELVLEVPSEEVEVAKKILYQSMEGVMSLDIPLSVNLQLGQNLGNDK